MKRYGVFEDGDGSTDDDPQRRKEDFDSQEEAESFARSWHRDNKNSGAVVYDSVAKKVVFRLPKPGTA
jgi:hypothetical protein